MSDIATRNKRNRAAGAKWQSDLRNGFRSDGYDIERLALAGKEDEGDHVIRLTGGLWFPPKFIVLEAKAGEMHPAEFVRQADLEARHYAEHRGINPEQVMGMAAVKRRGANWRDGYLLTSFRTFFRLGDK